MANNTYYNIPVFSKVHGESGGYNYEKLHFIAITISMESIRPRATKYGFTALLVQYYTLYKNKKYYIKSDFLKSKWTLELFHSKPRELY